MRASYMVMTVLAFGLIFGGTETWAMGRASDNAVGSLSTEQQKVLEIKPDDRVLGDSNAPVTLVEYASLTCHHCADFHEQILPLLKKEYILTGKIKMVYRDFPFDAYALKAAVLARCAPSENFFGMIDLLMRKQKLWTQTPDPTASLKQLGALGGVSPEKYESCLADKALQESIAKRQMDAENILGVSSTPSFFVNGKQAIKGALPYAEFKKHLDAALAGK